MNARQPKNILLLSREKKKRNWKMTQLIFSHLDTKDLSDRLHFRVVVWTSQTKCNWYFDE